jgi:heme/copper-type cytochrome/quinol oxidase subunit 2
MESVSLFAQQQPDGAGGVFAGLAGLVVVFWIIGILAFAFWLWMLIAALSNEPTTNEKILWVVLMIFLPVIGSLIYFIMRYRGRGQRTV